MGFFDFFRSSKNVRKAIPASGGLVQHAQQTRQFIDSLAKGGKIKKTGVYKIHKGERVVEKALNKKKK